MENGRHPIDRGCLTPAEDGMAAAGGEWLGETGEVHKPKGRLGQLSNGKRLLV